MQYLFSFLRVPLSYPLGPLWLNILFFTTKDSKGCTKDSKELINAFFNGTVKGEK